MTATSNMIDRIQLLQAKALASPQTSNDADEFTAGFDSAMLVVAEHLQDILDLYKYEAGFSYKGEIE